MLKKNNVGGTKGVKRTGEVKIFKIVKVVPKQGLVVEFQDGEQAMLTASSYFVTMKNLLTAKLFFLVLKSLKHN
jgi:hypothetical protein